MDMPARTFRGGPGGHRYGFNGKERDKDMNSLTAYDYGFRIYNPAIGKFLSVDPLTKSYPWYSPYHFAGNQPIVAIDLDGAEPKWFQDLMDFFGAGPEKVNSEVESTSRIATNEADFKESLPESKDGGPGGVAREMIINNQYVKDYSNAADYFTRPYKITNFTAGVVYPGAAAINGGISVGQGNYFWGTVDVLTSGVGGKFSTAQRLTPSFRGPMIAEFGKGYTRDILSASALKDDVYNIIESSGIQFEGVSIYGQGDLDKFIVLGRNQLERVNVAADYLKTYGFNVKTITDDIVGGPSNPLQNGVWLDNQLKQGYSIIDIGLDPKYQLTGDRLMDYGKFYSYEEFLRQTHKGFDVNLYKGKVPPPENP